MGFFDSLVGKKDKKYWLNLGNEYLKNNRNDEAIKSFEEILKLDQNDFHAWKNIGDVYYKIWKYDPALSAYNKALAANPKNIEILSNKAHIQLEKENFTECLEICNQILNIFSDNQRCLFLKARALSSLNQNEEAIDTLYKILKINQNLPEVWQSLAIQLTILERDDEAYEAYKQLLKINQNENTWENFANFLEQSENYEHAISAFEKYLALSGDEYNLGNVLKRANLYEKIDREDISKPLYEWAINTCNNLEINDGHYVTKTENSTRFRTCPVNKALEYKAQALLGLKRFDSALQVCEKILKKDPQSFNGLFSKARVLSDLQQYDKAVIFLDQIIVLYPKARAAKRLREIILNKISKEPSGMDNMYF